MIEQTRRTAPLRGEEKHEGLMIETPWTSNTDDLLSPDAAEPSAKTKSTVVNPELFKLSENGYLLMYGLPSYLPTV